MYYKIITFFVVTGLILTSCLQEEPVFEKSSDERVTEAIAGLKEKLVAPANGWIVKYQPEEESGYFHVIMKFGADNSVTLSTDYSGQEGKFYTQTITYRIDNSLGLELVFESYSFFSHLTEQDQASFMAEYEFKFVNEENGSLIFRSKTDVGSSTILTFVPAIENQETILGRDISKNLSVLTEDLQRFTSVYKLSYLDIDQALYLTFNNLRRTLDINYVSTNTDLENGQKLEFSTPFVVEGNAIVFDKAFSANFSGRTIDITGIQFDQLDSSTIAVCAAPLDVHKYSGSISGSGERVFMETTLFDPNGRGFTESTDFMYNPVQYMFNEGVSAVDEVTGQIPGALDMQIYYDQDGDEPFLALGFRVENANETVTYALKEFTPTFNGNQIGFTFTTDYKLYGDTTAIVNTAKMDEYINIMTEGGNTYILKYSDQIYEFYNPCNGWSFVFLVPN